MQLRHGKKNNLIVSQVEIISENMWVNVLLFLVGLVTAAYFYMTRKFGSFKAHGIWEYEPSFPFGSTVTKDIFTGQVNFARMLEKMYHE